MRWIADDPSVFYPDLDNEALAVCDERLPPGSYDPKTGRLTQSTHSWLLQMPGRTVLIDTATGNGKSLPTVPRLHHLNELYLERLAAAGAPR